MSSEIILVVDDEPVVLKIVTAILTNAGFQVLAAASPEEALTTGRQHPQPIRLILSDVVMPGLCGPDLAEAFEALHPETAWLFMAGMPDSPEVEQRILDRGLAFLPKPFGVRTLLNKVDEVLGRAAAAATAG
jgi:two-component system, cell cycle sensor histidine kinase and response regulator CckA